jgi:broad specificity phosphatase PhoE
MAKRMLEAVWQGVKKYPGKNLVFVSHRDPILALLLKISKRSFNDLNEVKPFCDKGSVLEVHLMGRKLVNKSF